VTARARGQDLFGRDDVRERLQAHLDAVGDGDDRFVWLAGEAGIGKTRLLDDLAATAEARGVRVLRGTGWDDPGTPPFWLWAQVLREAAAGRDVAALRSAWGPGADEALHLLRGGEGAAVPSARFTLFESLAAAVAALCAEGPLVLVLDDLHWADAGSLRALEHVRRALVRRPLLVAAGWRTHELAADDEVAERGLALASRADTVDLSGLSPDAVGAVVAEVVGKQLDAATAQEVARRTAGNPLFVRELARLARDRGTALLDGVPDSAQAIIRRRLARVSQACHEVLAVAAVAGTAASLDLVASLTGSDVAEVAGVAGVVDEGVAAGLVVLTGAGHIGFTHPVVRDTLIAATPANRSREIHLAAAGLLGSRLADDPSGAAEVAQHLCAALPLADAADAVAMLRRAAAVASQALAFEEAAGHLARALDVVPPTVDRLDVLLDWGAALAAAGDVEKARKAYESAADVARNRGDAAGLSRAALGFGAGLSGFEVQLWDQAQIDLLEEALAALPDEDSETRADVMARLSVALAFTEGASRRDRLAADAVDMARRIGAPRVVAHALAAHCDAISGPDDSERREAEAGEVVVLAHAAGDRGLELLGLRLRVVALLEQGRVAEARDDMATFGRLSAQVGQPLYAWYVPLWRGYLAHASGDLDEMQRCTGEVARVGELAESTNARILSIVQRPWPHIERNEAHRFVDEMRELLDELAELAPDGGVMMGLYPGQPDAVRRGVLPRLAWSLGRLAKDSEYLSNHSLVCLSLYAGGDEAEHAEAAYRGLLPYRHRFAVDGIAAGAIGSVERMLGLAATLAGRYDDAVTHFEEAITRNRAALHRLAAAHAQADLAECLRRRGCRQDGPRIAGLVAEARAEYLAMGIPERAAILDARPPTTTSRSSTATLHRDGAVWSVTFRGRSTTMRHQKGLADLAVLLARPGHETHVLDLAAAPVSVPQGDLGEVLDDRARAAYRQRLAELDELIEDAGSDRDDVRAADALEERDALVAELASAYGLHGRARRTGSQAERARTTVTRRIREVIQRADEAMPELGRHLRSAVRTGTFCVYDPEEPVAWDVSSQPISHREDGPHA
jgi:tetratricopeptide (TPR) repeat protein